MSATEPSIEWMHLLLILSLRDATKMACILEEEAVVSETWQQQR
jgi:hypothetical protein